jgi:DNA-binding GntR family transcriptional regulator
VYRVLRAAILDGRVTQGSQLREAHIAADLGISRSPLREALTRLEEEGLVVKLPFRGAFVAVVSDEDIAEIASIRLLVEPYAGDLALEALRGDGRSTLMEAVEALRAAADRSDIPASIDAHLQFHRFFYDLSGHGVLRGLWNGWETKLRMYLTVDHRTYNDLADLAAEHQRLADAALGGDMELFRRELAQHFQSALHHGSVPRPQTADRA